MSDQKSITIYTDGGARGNPGPAAIGVVFMNGAEIVEEYKEFIGDTTNNQAEYRAVLAALDIAAEKGYTHLDFFLDSQLVAEQLNRNYKVKEKGLQQLFLEAWNKIQGFTKVTFSFIPREKNTEADRLVNEALDEGEDPDFGVGVDSEEEGE
ncbi:MAG: ribonuclease HI family protein [Patescibacteria group bacterium]|jgi:ribonuclease HI